MSLTHSLCTWTQYQDLISFSFVPLKLVLELGPMGTEHRVWVGHWWTFRFESEGESEEKDNEFYVISRVWTLIIPHPTNRLWGIISSHDFNMNSSLYSLSTHLRSHTLPPLTLVHIRSPLDRECERWKVCVTNECECVIEDEVTSYKAPIRQLFIELL